MALTDQQLPNGVAAAPYAPPMIPDPLPDHISEEIAAYCTVMRFGPHDPTSGQRPVPARVGKLTAPFDLDVIGQTFGPGRFVLQFHDQRHQYLGRSEISVEAPPAPAPTPWGAGAGAPQPRNFSQNPHENPYYGAPYAPPAAPLELVLARLAQLEARLAAPAAPPAAATPALTVQDMLSMFTAAATILKPADPDLMAKYFTTGMRLAREATGGASSRGDDAGGGWPQVIAALGPQLLETLNRMVPPPGVIATPPAAPAPGAPAAVVQGGAVPKWLQELIQELQRGIATDDDPEYTADWIVRNVPPQFVQQLCEPEEKVLATLETYKAIVPELGTDQGKAYSKAVLAALREDQLGEVRTPGAEGTAAGV